jgi:glycosyltransferase involved in cell wall biosynthesis
VPSLHIALNLVFLHERSGGAGRYALDLVPALLAAEPGLRITAFATPELPAAARGAAWSGAIEWVTLPVSTTGARRGSFALATAAQWGAIPLLGALRGVDVFHGLANVAPLWAPRAARVVTLLDVVWLRYPDALSPAATLGMRRVALPSARRADRVIAISNAAKADIVAETAIAADRIDVVELGISDAEPPAGTPQAQLREQLGLGDAQVVLSVSQKRVHKNLAGLIGAFARLDRDAMVLVLPGAPTPHEAELRALAERLGVADRVRFPGWVSERDLEGLYRIAACFVLPSFEEGFGLPVLEAMHRGVPVACSRTSSVGEVAGDAAELFDPGDEADIARALSAVVDDAGRRAALVAAGRARCAHFTWEQTARKTLSTYRAALGGRRS